MFENHITNTYFNFGDLEGFLKLISAKRGYLNYCDFRQYGFRQIAPAPRGIS